ncbi:MAG: helix-turn-helix domain-containing protein [Kiritimatiellae bacterium]|nr:helix-turn-helix domain-containing protein [Kiritimatiellia bacterium]
MKIKEARRAAKLSQTVVAAEVGCKQSALSMFEQGDGTKLNEDVIGKLAKKFGISLTAVAEKEAEQLPRVPLAFVPVTEIKVHGFCPNPHCPSNKVYEVDGRTLALPSRMTADPVGGKFCALCGEVLEKRCPNCGAPVHDGAVCSLCGDPYVAVC